MHFFNPLLLFVVVSLAGVVNAAPLGKGIEPDALAKGIMDEADFSAESASAGPSVSGAASRNSVSAVSVPSAAPALPTVSAAAPVAAPAVTVVTEVVTVGGGVASSTSSPSPAPSNMVPSKESVSGMNPFTNPFWEAWNAEWNRQKEAAAAAASAAATAATAGTAAEDGNKDLSAEEQIAEDRRKQEEEIKKKIAIEKEQHDYEVSQYDPFEDLNPGCPPKAAGGAELVYWLYCLFGHETYDYGEHWY